jgi:hypothetical protein
VQDEANARSATSENPGRNRRSDRQLAGPQAEEAMVAFAPGQPAAVTFRNLYKSKAPLSRSIDWDADIHHTEIDAPLLAQMATADTLDLKLAHKRYAIALTGFASRFESFRQFCEKGTVRDPRHFDTRR